MRILFTGGGTGGHITPIIAVARQLKNIYPVDSKEDLKMFFLGAKGPSGFDNVFEEEGIKVKTILAGKFRRYFSINFFSDLFKIPVSLCQSLWYVFLWMPDVIFNKGGYGSAPVVIAGWFYHIPIITHESDAIPGLATRLGGKLSKRIAVSFEEARKYFNAKKTALIGNPVRKEITQTCALANEENKLAAKKILGITSDKPIIFILGGSQGAKAIDQVVLSIVPQLFGKYEVIHQCCDKDYEDIKKETESIEKYHLFSFLNENQLISAFLLADIVISRAGAASIFEIASCGRPSILIPLPDSAADHQRENAFDYAKSGATSVIEQINLTPNILLSEIARIVDNPELAAQMIESAKNFSNPDAARKIAEELIALGS